MNEQAQVVTHRLSHVALGLDEGNVLTDIRRQRPTGAALDDWSGYRVHLSMMDSVPAYAPFYAASKPPNSEESDRYIRHKNPRGITPVIPHTV